MLNLLAGGILFLISSYVGLQIKRYFKRRKDFFADFVALIDVLHDEVSYLKSPLPKILERFSGERRGDLADMLDAYSQEIGSGGDLSAETLPKILNLTRFSSSEKEGIVSFFASLGKTDSKTQLMSLKNYRTKFVTWEQDAEKKYKTTGLLAQKLGVLLGIGVMILVA